MAQEDVFLTREGYDELKKEYDHLTRVRRREFSKAIEHARALGDLRENAEYQAAKEAQGLNEKRIAELEGILSHTRIVEDENIDKDKALLGAKVKVRTAHDNEVDEYTLVSEAEADFDKNKISVTSPLGKGLLGHKEGDVIQVKIPAGIITVEILRISR